MSAREPLLSNDWYRVAELRLCLRPGVQVARQLIRGEIWYVLTDPVTGAHHRFNDAAYRLIGPCDGNVTLESVWAAQVMAERDGALTQHDAIRVVSQAYAANLLTGDVPPDVAALMRTGSTARRRRILGALNPLAFRVPLCDPDSFLNRHINLVRWCFSRRAAWACAGVAFIGAALWAMNAQAFAVYANAHLATPRMFLLLWLAYPIIKLLHEAAHAFAVKAFGGEVHAMGVTLLFLTPVPYVDASASTAFPAKGERAAVALVGIAVELVIATLAAAVWLAAEPGIVRDTAFAVALMGGVSTLVVNGNPLLKFDGYYAFCDAFELPNLAARSARYWVYLAQRYVLRIDRARFPAMARGELPWLLAYAPAAVAYRVCLLALFVLLVADWSASVALALVAYAAFAFVLRPAFNAVQFIRKGPEVAGHRTRSAVIAAGGGAVLAVVVCIVPLPQVTRAPGLVWLPDNAQVRAGVEGFVEEVYVRDGDAVEPGTVVARLSNAPLLVALKRVEADLVRRDVEHAARFGTERLRAALAEDEIARLRAERDRLQHSIDQLTVRAEIGGKIVVPKVGDLPGKHLAQGELLAQVLPPEPPLVRSLVRNEDVALVRAGSRSIEVSIAHRPGESYAATLEHEIPQASSELPSAALGVAGGGGIDVDPSDPSGRTAREPRFQFDLRLPAAVAAHVGTRVLVTFQHDDATAAEQLGGFVRRVFLRHFER
jgi:putative peptide zinc metalloprotease protein